MSEYKYPQDAGIFEVPEHEYHELEAGSASGLRAMRRSPAHFRYDRDNPSDPTPAMRDGTAIHMAILEPWRFAEKYVVEPDNAPRRPTQRQIDAKKPSQATIDAIQFWDMFDKQYPGAQFISQDKLDQYVGAAKAVQQHPLLKTILQDGMAEQSVFARDPATKVWCKCRPDWVAKVAGNRVMLEIKTTADAQPWPFQRNAYSLCYYEAAAFYCDMMDWAGLGRPDLYLIAAVEKEAPHGVMVYQIPEQDLLRAKDSYRPYLDRYAECLEADHWPAYDTTTISQLPYPAWAGNDRGEDNAD
jgi:exodeoxyribonuclease VIII